MKSKPLLDVSMGGAVILGPSVVCDGFVRDYPYRIQTHIHDDHMDDFETSKGLQEILVSEATRELLIAELNAELEYRRNIRVLPLDTVYPLGDYENVQILSNGHMLGSVQVAVTLPDNTCLGYSGDFQWPLDKVIRVDGLVVDSTYGSPDHKRYYMQADVDSQFVELVVSKVKRGPVFIKAFRGTIQRALELLAELRLYPMLVTERLHRECAVYSNFGYHMPLLLQYDSPEGRQAMRDGYFIVFGGTGDPRFRDLTQWTTLTLSAYMSDPHSPILQLSDRAYQVSMSDHADFNGTIEYVRASGAKFVVTDNRRGTHGVELANELRQRLGVDARPSTTDASLEWGV